MISVRRREAEEEAERLRKIAEAEAFAKFTADVESLQERLAAGKQFADAYPYVKYTSALLTAVVTAEGLTPALDAVHNDQLCVL